MTTSTSPDAATTPDTPSTDPPRLLSRAHLPVAGAAVGLVTLSAFENRAVGTVLPTVAHDLGGLALFGAANAAPLVAFVVSIAVAGTWADHRGPIRPLGAGLATFALAQACAGLAPSMAVFVGARLVSGVAEGLVDIGLNVLVARALPAALRPKVFATFAAAWVLPSVLGPGVAGGIAEHAGWRWVFLLAVALLVPCVALLTPTVLAVRRTPVPGTPWSDAERRRVRWAALAALALAAVTAGGVGGGSAGGLRPAGPLLLAAGLVVLAAAARAMLPPGSLRARPGIPALVAFRALLAVSFGTMSAHLPLMLTELRGLGPQLAGVSLSIAGVFWSVGSWLQSPDAVQRRVPPEVRLRVGFGLIALGAAGPALLALDEVPLAAGLAGWAVCGVGIGMSSPTVSTQVLALAPRDGQGRAVSATGLANSMGSTVGLTVAGAAVAAAAPDLGPGLFVGIILGSAALAVLGALLAPRGAGGDTPVG